MSLTKAQEMEILTAAAKKLGTDSYAGPWLANLLPFIESDLRSDLCPEYDLRKTQAEVKKMLAEAKIAAEQHLKTASATAMRQASEIVTNAHEKAGRIQMDLARAIRVAERAINDC
jgi:hypothetical protein